MSLLLDTSEMEARLEQRIADRVIAEITQLLNANGNNGHGDEGGERWLTLKMVAVRLARSRRTVTEMVKAGEFPRHAVILHGSKMWSAGEVDQWMKETEERGSV